MIKHIVLVSAVLGIFIGLVIIISLPSNVSYSILNNEKQGYSLIAEKFDAEPITNPREYERLDPFTDVVLIPGPSLKNPTVVDNILEFVKRGGKVIVSADSDEIEPLFEKLNIVGVNITLGGGDIYDVVYNYMGNRSLIKALSTFDPDCCQDVYIPSAYSVIGDIEPICTTSNYSYVDLDGNGFYDPGEPIGSQVIVGRVLLGNGSIIIVASGEAFINKFAKFSDGLLMCVKGDGRLYIDQVHISQDIIEGLKISFYYGNVLVEKYSIIILASVLGVLAYFVNERSF